MVKSQMNKKELQQATKRIKKANNAVKSAILALGDCQKMLHDYDLDEGTTQKLAALLKDYYNDCGCSFESPYGSYGSWFQKFEDNMRTFEKAIIANK